MPKYAVMSIVHQFLPERYREFDHFYDAAGQNTGNLLFSTAVWRQLDADKKRVGFKIDPDRINETADALVIPAANWINPRTDLGVVADAVEKLTIPVVIIGLGAQSARIDDDPRVAMPDGTLRLLKAISERSNALSVRGGFTKKVLAEYGINNVVVTGCPSLYADFGPTRKPQPKTAFDLEKCLLHATRYSIKNPDFLQQKNTPTNLNIFRFAYKNRIDLLYQSEPEELAALFGYGDRYDMSDTHKENLAKVYGASGFADALAYIQRHGRAYAGMQVWSKAMRNYQFVIGTRLHGTIMALNSGVPATLITHDSRTREIADFAAIPAISADDFKVNAHQISNAYEKFNFSSYKEQRKTNHDIYRKFLLDNGLATTLQE